VRKLRAVSLFAGAGGLDYGFEAAGFGTRAAVEWDPDCCETVRGSRRWPIICDDINNIESNTLLQAARLRRGETDVLIGGPSCQPFSKAGYWVNGDAQRLKDPRAQTLHAYMRCAGDLLPKVFLLENVHGIAYAGKGEGLDLLARLTKQINRRTGARYELSWAVLNAADYGAPQVRHRFFLVGDRQGRTFHFPEPTHGPVGGRAASGKILSPYTTAWDAIGGITPPLDEDLAVKGRWADLLPSIPEGENYLWHTSRKGGLPLFGWRRRYWSFLLKLAKDRPSWTLQASPGPATGPFHWESRRLSVGEMARLQTFPTNVRFSGNSLSVQRQLGNAVPSLLAEILAREIRTQLLGIPITGPPKLAVSTNQPVPAPEPVKPVPKEYRVYVRDHSAHPGEGRGPRAQSARTRKLRRAASRGRSKRVTSLSATAPRTEHQ
jgi:DNA (cytosine-5)-methyltransferase 1